jgi:hypothetical protein
MALPLDIAPVLGDKRQISTAPGHLGGNFIAGDLQTRHRGAPRGRVMSSRWVRASSLDQPDKRFVRARELSAAAHLAAHE